MTNDSPLVLIAEDSVTQSRRLQYILEQQCYRVVSKSNGRAALQAARDERPALIISDVVMPEMSGYELCHQIKQDPDLRDVPVILVTTLSDPQDVIRGLECGADNFILKPYETDQLLRRIQLVLVNDGLSRRPDPADSLEIVFRGQKHCITADREQILNLLLSTYEAAIERNTELTTTRDELRHANQELQQMTLELEQRVRERTSELESANAQLRQAQQSLIQQERLRALGQMASGIAHDINNAISPISLYTDLLLAHEKGLSESARSQLETIGRAIEDVARTVGRMREFYRPHEESQLAHHIDPNQLIKQVIDLTRAKWSNQAQRGGAMIQFSTELTDRLPAIKGADNEIRDALTNLIFNAVDAMPLGGTITIRTDTEKGIGTNGAPMLWVRLEVTDTGTGMDEDTRKRCLEPFFTTKGERGTGLGLAMVYGMAQRHRALLEVDSQKGVGTTMRLLFPVSDTTSQVTAETTVATGPIHRQKILVVDDDPMLSQSLRNTLQADGHEVVVASGGKAGIETFQAAQLSLEPFDVVITDLGMPNVDGRQVARAVRNASAHVPIIMLTGWGRNLLADTTPPPEVSRLLSKPPRLSELRTALAELTEATFAATPELHREANRRDPH
jgi:signal transduction histidine kinase